MLHENGWTLYLDHLRKGGKKVLRVFMKISNHVEKNQVTNYY